MLYISNSSSEFKLSPVVGSLWTTFSTVGASGSMPEDPVDFCESSSASFGGVVVVVEEDEEEGSFSSSSPVFLSLKSSPTIRHIPTFIIRKLWVNKKIHVYATPLFAWSSVNIWPPPILCMYAMGRSEMLGKMPPNMSPQNHCFGEGVANFVPREHAPPRAKRMSAERTITPMRRMSCQEMLPTILLKVRQGRMALTTILEMPLATSIETTSYLASKYPTNMMA